jgi:signal transduction histidine kinase
MMVEQDAKEVYAPLEILVYRQMSMAGILIVLVILLGFIFGRILADPIEKLRGAMVRISGGDIDYKIEIKSGDEIEQLADTFKQMMSNIKNKQALLVSSGEKLTAAMKAKSYFTSLVSHELRTPLAAIREGIAIVLDSTLGVLNKDQDKCLNIAKKNVDRLTRLINEVLDFQKLESGKVAFAMQENDINEVVNEIHETMLSLAASKGLGFSLELDRSISIMEFDKDKIAQVLTNVVNNAIKFTQKGGITILTSKGTNYVQISVKDTGPGIDEEDMPRLFQAFEQFGNVQHGDDAGTGLGLVISKDIIVKHNGRIWAESKVGQGTIFHIILPVKERRR